jgi:hypothetical protein
VGFLILIIIVQYTTRFHTYSLASERNILGLINMILSFLLLVVTHDPSSHSLFHT